MQLLKDKIVKEGKILPGNIVKAHEAKETEIRPLHVATREIHSAPQA